MKRTLDDKVIGVRSWHSRAHSLLSLARRAQPKEVSSASHSSSLLSLAIHRSSLLSSTIQSSSLLSSARRAHLCAKRSARLEELSFAQRGQLGQKRSARPQELSSAQRGQLIQQKRSAHPGEISSTHRGQLIQESSALPKEASSATTHSFRPFRVKRP